MALATKRKRKKRQSPKRGPSIPKTISGRVMGLQNSITERNGFLQASTAGQISWNVDVNWSTLTLGARAAGWEAVYEEYRIDHVLFETIPICSYDWSGGYGIYIDRNTADAILANWYEICIEPESKVQSIHTPSSIVWTPKEPEDREFIPFATDTVRAKLHILSNAVIDSAGSDVGANLFFHLITTTHFVLRGRST